jgi:hypothetical protein
LVIICQHHASFRWLFKSTAAQVLKSPCTSQCSSHTCICHTHSSVWITDIVSSGLNRRQCPQIPRTQALKQLATCAWTRCRRGLCDPRWRALPDVCALRLHHRMIRRPKVNWDGGSIRVYGGHYACWYLGARFVALRQSCVSKRFRSCARLRTAALGRNSHNLLRTLSVARAIGSRSAAKPARGCLLLLVRGKMAHF